MFDQLFKAQRARERHLNAPLVDERIRYLSHWAAQGSIRSSLRVRAQDLLTFIDYLHLETVGEIDEKQISKAAERWATRQPQPHNVIDFRYGKLRFISHARQWIAFLGRLHQPEVPRPPYTHMIEEFSDYMREEKGLSLVTIHKRRQHATQFLSRFDEQHRPFNEISILDIDAAIARKGEHDAYTRSSMRTYANVAERFRALNIPSPHRGPDSLRHACATRLLAEGLSMKEIGDHLGHRKPDSTRVYAKVDLAGLRQVADFEIGGVL